jgi:hypothetical protein
MNITFEYDENKWNPKQLNVVTGLRSCKSCYFNSATNGKIVVI